MKHFRGRVAVVTGAASGIGRAMAERFALEGMKIVLADIEEPALDEVERDMRENGANVIAVRTDVSNGAQVKALAGRALEAFGAVHIVCNNAGVASLPAPVWEQTEADWRWVIDVNLWGVIHGIRTFLPILLEQGGEGHVVNTASLSGLIALPNAGPYDATKFAVVAISESLYFDLALIKSLIHVSVVCPAWVQTRILDAARNRPPELAEGPHGPVRAEVVQKFDDAFRKRIIEQGLTPEVVAQKVFEAVHDEKLYVWTHPEYKPNYERRCGEILNERNPDVAATLGRSSDLQGGKALYFDGSRQFYGKYCRHVIVK
jgi:NAD(P)-dependent dehydrogenase (short-subunit alcohol dehydrogenase family)